MGKQTAREQPKAAERGIVPDVSGNPSGRSKDSRDKTTLAIAALLEGEAEGLTRKAIERALEGDATALRLCLERLTPPCRDRPTPFDMPAVTEAADARDAFAAVLRAIAEGSMTLSEATTAAKLISDFVAVDRKTETDRKMRARKVDGPRPLLRTPRRI